MSDESARGRDGEFGIRAPVSSTVDGDSPVVAARRVSSVRFDDSPQYYAAPEFPDDDQDTTGDNPMAARQEHLKEYLAVCLGLRSPPQVLDEVSFEGVARYIASGKVHNIITMVGAGISTSAGIPDFRSPDIGLYDKLKKEYGVEDPTTLFSSEHFMKDPKPFYERAHLFFKDDYKPTPCHYFIRMLHDKGLLLRNYSQNIDTLDRMAGIPEDKLIEAHGSWSVSYCLECCEDYSYDWMKEKIRSGAGVPKCDTEGCTGIIKPDIVLFGESLPWRLMENVQQDFRKCDLLIIMGTSLAVQPFASLTHKVPISTPRLYINRDKGAVCKKHPMAAVVFGGSFDFDEEDNTRDVFKGTDCDAGCLEMADLLGWGEELRELVKTEHNRLSEEYAKARPKTPVSKPKMTSSASAVTSTNRKACTSKEDTSRASPRDRKTSSGGGRGGEGAAVTNGTKAKSASVGVKAAPSAAESQTVKAKPAARHSHPKRPSAGRSSTSSTSSKK